MKNPELIRRIKFIDPETGKRLVFLTHNMTVSSEGVAISPVTLYNPAKHTMNDDCIYQHQGGVFMCVDWKTGETRYEGGRNIGKGSLTWAEGLIYFFNERGEVLLIRPNPERYEVISRFELPEGGEGPTWAHPVVCGKRLYLRHGTFLYCFDIAR